MKNVLKVLLLEDFQADITLAEREIKRTFPDADLLVTDNEAGLISALDQFQPDIVLSDYNMPAFTGMQALKIVIEKDPTLPFIMLTGSLNEETAVECMKAGAWDYVIKEHIRRLGSAMGHALKEKELRKEKIRIEEENKINHEKLKSIFNASTMGIGLVINRVIIEINEAICKITGYSREELIGRNARFLYPDEEEYNRIGKIIAEMERDEIAETETIWIRKSGEPMHIYLSANHLNPADKQKGLIVTVLDMTSMKKTQELLREKENIYNSFVEASNDLMFIKDENKKYLIVNGATEKFFKRSMEEIIGKTDFELMSEEQANICLKSDERVINEKTIVVNYENIGKKVFETTKFPLTLSENRPGIGAIIRDVTEKHRNDLIMMVQYAIADAVLMAKTAHELYKIVKSVLNRLFDTSNFYIALYNPKTGMLSTPFLTDEKDNIQEWPAEKSLTGYLIHEKRPLLLKKKDIDDLAEKGLIKHLGSRSECWMGIPLINENNVFGAMVTQNYHDPDAYSLQDLDVFEIIANQFSIYLTLKRAEEEAKKLSTAVVQSPAAIIITDKDGLIEYVNPKFEEVTGYSFEEVEGKKLGILKSGFHPRAYYQELWATITSGKIWQGEFYNRKKNGQLYWESARIAPIFSADGEITHFLGVKEDITEKKQMIEDLIAAKERAEESDRLKSSFLNNISHEIRTPLNGIIGFIELLTAPGTTMEELQEYIEVIKDCGYQLIDVVTETVNYSMIESGQEKAVYRMFDVNRMINNLYRQYEEKNKNPEVNFLLVNSISEAEKEVLTDETKLKQIINNLLSNAFKFTEKGEVSLMCERRENELYFRVSDTGIGIAPENHEFIFEKFTKVESDKSQLFRGTGLGLAICKAYTELLNGRIRVESELGKGTVFHVTIPIKN